jgi:ABC-2 type transport system permease protein
MVYQARRVNVSISLPGFWRETHEVFGQIIMFFAVVTVVNVTAPEYSWKTSRQNVIDGLSREQWFTAKLLMVPVIVLLFYLLGVIIIGVTGTVFGEHTSQFITGPQIRAITIGTLLANLGFSSFALLASFLTRNTAGAIALVLGYISLGEQLLVVLMERVTEGFGQNGKYLPGRVFSTLASMNHWDPRPLPERFAAVMRERMGDPPDTTVLVALALMYTGLCIAGSFLLVRKQDL